jgi:protein SCO1/2
MRRYLPIVTLIVMACFLVSVTALMIHASGVRGSSARNLLSPQAIRANSDPTTPDYGLEGVRVPAFSLIDHEGNPVTEAMLDGKITVMDFMFTNCPFICPGLATVMSQVHNELADTPVLFLSISVDPAHDTPEALRNFGARYGADLNRWRFLTGNAKTVKHIVEDSLGLALEDDPDTLIELPDGSVMTTIIHPGKLVLVGPDRQVLGMYDYNQPDRIRELVNRIRYLLEH